MPWYSPWSDHIAKSVCKYLLQRYLGQFLEEKLTLDQLTVDLHKGIGVISDVALDVQALNEVAEQQNVPFEFTDGFIEKMAVSIPWSSIFTDATNIEVEGLSLTVKRIERDKTGISMIESMWSSMTSSMQLAEDCLKKERDNSKEEGSHTFEGIESLAHTIDSILSRIKIKFLNTIIRLEEIVESNAFGIALEISIKLFEYFDEVVAEDKEEPKLEYQLSAFSTKKIYLEGVNLYSDEFSLSPTNEPTLGSFNEDNQKVNIKNLTIIMNEEIFSDESPTENILVGSFAGRQELTLKFKQEGVEGPKVDIQISLGAFTAFLSPHQAHNLLHLVSGMTSSAQNSRKKAKNQCLQKAMGESDFRKIEQELQMNLKEVNSFQPKGLSNHGWASTCLDVSEDEFTPMNNSSRLNDSVISLSSSFSSSIMSTSSRSSNRQFQNSFTQLQRKSHSGNTDIDPNAIVFHFHILLSSLSIILLHEDVLTVSADSNQSTITKFSFEEMRNLASEFFEKLERFVAMGYGNKDFENARELFQSICQLNHIRLTAAPIIIEGNEVSTSNVSVIKGNCTVSSMEIVETLFEKENHSEKQIVENVELLNFKKSSKDKKDSPHASLVQPKVLINFRFSQTNSLIDKGKRSIQPKTNLSFELEPFETEIDITMVDRVSALLSPKSFFKAQSLLTSNLKNCTNKEYFEQVVYSSSTPNSKQELKLTSSFVTLKIRFPIPDLRPIHDMDKPPWWKRSIRKDILYLDVTDLSLHTVLDSTVTFFKYDFQFRDVVAKFKEGDLDNLVELAKASAFSNCENIKKGIGWPRISLHIYPKMNPTDLEESELNLNHFKMSHNSGYQSLLHTLETTAKKEHSPFSRQKVVHESDTPHSKTSHAEQGGEEIIIPGDNAEIADFIDVASVNTRIKLDVTLPVVSVILPSKHLFEVLYNRISSDLLLWEPSAPVSYDFCKNSNLNVQPTMEDLMSTFSLCKSAMQDSESDSDAESQDGIFYSVYEQKQKHKKKQLSEKNILMGQSKIVCHINVTQGTLDLYAPVRDSQGNVIPRQHGQLHFSVDEGNLFLVSGYKGKSDLDYVCVQVNRFSFYHCGLLSDSDDQPVLRTVNILPKNLELTVQKTEKCALIDQSTNVGTGSSSLDMLTLSVSLQKHHLTQGLKVFRVAIGIREATLFHKVCNTPNNWFSQLVDFFDVTDYPIAGYDPSSVLSEINVHLWNCSVDYRPLYLPLRSILNLGNFNISSNIAAQTSSSTLRFIAEDVSFFISDKTGGRFARACADLRKDYVCVMELGLFELSLRLSEKAQVNPKVDLRASGNVAHLWTCSDSARALTELLLYFASDGDLMTNESNKEEKEQSFSPIITDNDQVLVKTGDSENTHSLSKSQVAMVNDLMEEAMKESKIVEMNDKKIKEDSSRRRSRDKSDDKKTWEDEKTKFLSSELQYEVNSLEREEKDDNWEKDFYIVENEAGMGIIPKKGLPEVRYLTNVPVRLVDNHFSIPLGKADLLQSPKHYPKPLLRYMLRELSLVWHMFGGSDFERDNTKPSKNDFNQNSESENGKSNHSETVVTFSKNSSTGLTFKTKQDNKINWKQRGGAHRRYDVLMELQLNKVRFQHEVYPENTVKASRQVLLIQDVELRDRLASSTINKFLYQYSSESKPKQSQTPMVFVKSVLVRSDPKMNAQECSLKVSLLPLRLNIDQDSILFLYQFFRELSNGCKDDEDDSNSRSQTPKHQVPVMTVNVQNSDRTTQPEPLPLLIDLEEQNLKAKKCAQTKRKGFVPKNKPSSQPIFIRCFIFSPEVLVKLDYQGKRVDMTHGSLAGILMGLGQLNNSELKLRKISHRHGLLGFDKLMNFVLSEWANDIKKNQLPSLLGGVGPMHSLVQLIQGIRDLFWLPIEQYQKDGRLVRGFQRGANSFTTSTAMASLELISRLIQIIQSTAETAYDIVSPGPSVRSCRQKKGKGKSKRYSQPADIREGVAIAYLVVKEGIGETAETIVRVASEEHEQKGVTGAVGGVLRQIPPTMVKPIILATEATNNVIGGMRSQLIPDVRKEAFEKWKMQDM